MFVLDWFDAAYKIVRSRDSMVIGTGGSGTGDYLESVLIAPKSFAEGVVAGSLFVKSASVPSTGESVIITGCTIGGAEIFSIYTDNDGANVTFQARYGANIFISEAVPTGTGLAWIHIRYYVDFVTPANTRLFLGGTEYTFDTVPAASAPGDIVDCVRCFNNWAETAEVAAFYAVVSPGLGLVTFLNGFSLLAESSSFKTAPRPYSLGEDGARPYYVPATIYLTMELYEGLGGAPFNQAQDRFMTNVGNIVLSHNSNATVGGSSNRALKVDFSTAPDATNNLIYSTNIITVPNCNRVFFSAFINFNGVVPTAPVLEFVSFGTGQKRGNFQLHTAGLITNATKIGVVSSIGAAQVATEYSYLNSITAPLVSSSTAWHWVIGFFSYGAGDTTVNSWLLVDDIQITFSSSVANAVVSDTAQRLHLAKGIVQNTAFSIAHPYVLFDSAILALEGGGVDFTNISDIKERFANTTEGVPKYQGRTGENAFGVSPDFYAAFQVNSTYTADVERDPPLLNINGTQGTSFGNFTTLVKYL